MIGGEFAPINFRLSDMLFQTACCNAEPYKLSEDQFRDFVMAQTKDIEIMENLLGWNGEERKHGIPVALLKHYNPSYIFEFCEDSIKTVLDSSSSKQIFIRKGTTGFGYIPSSGMPGIDINGDMALTPLSYTQYAVTILSGVRIYELRVPSSDVNILEDLLEPS
jgi:hypothetical protein